MHSRSWPAARGIHLLIVAALLLSAGIAGVVPARRALGASVLIVTTFADDTTPDNGTCSLGEAIAAANTRAIVDGCDPTGISSGAPVPIQLSAGTYLTSGSLIISGNMTISGAGAGVTIVQPQLAALGSVFINDGTLALSGLTITGGLATASTGGSGGGILNNHTLSLDGVRVTKNVAESGGGIFNQGALTIIRSSIDTNQGDQEGGGITSSGSSGGATTLEVIASTIAGNITGNLGGGVSNNGNSAASFTNTTITGNSAASQAAGLFNSDGGLPGSTNLVTLLHVTISHNTSASDAGGVDNFGVMTLSNTIIAQNTAFFVNPDCRNLSLPIESLSGRLKRRQAAALQSEASNSRQPRSGSRAAVIR